MQQWFISLKILFNLKRFWKKKLGSVYQKPTNIFRPVTIFATSFTGTRSATVSDSSMVSLMAESNKWMSASWTIQSSECRVAHIGWKSRKSCCVDWCLISKRKQLWWEQWMELINEMQLFLEYLWREDIKSFWHLGIKCEGVSAMSFNHGWLIL